MAKAKKEPTDWAARVADAFTRYIEENNTLPWLKGWTTDGIFPCNLNSKHTYQGINALLLGMMGTMRGYSTPYYLTIGQMNKMGGKFKDWEGDAKDNGLPIVFWKPLKVEDRVTGKDKMIFFLKGWTVWNIAHMEGIEVPVVEREPVVLSDALAALRHGYEGGPSIVETLSAQAYYTPSLHQVTIPSLSQFISEMAWGETMAHELIHSTGHPDLENRFEKGYVGGHEAYAKEELVAEIGAAIVLQRLGLEPEMQRMADYVKGWGSKIKDDPRMLISAANKADKAANRVLGIEVAHYEEAAA